jgi:hypothetical protein
MRRHAIEAMTCTGGTVDRARLVTAYVTI